MEATVKTFRSHPHRLGFTQKQPDDARQHLDTGLRLPATSTTAQLSRETNQCSPANHLWSDETLLNKHTCTGRPGRPALSGRASQYHSTSWINFQPFLFRTMYLHCTLVAFHSNFPLFDGFCNWWRVVGASAATLDLCCIRQTCCVGSAVLHRVTDSVCVCVHNAGYDHRRCRDRMLFTLRLEEASYS